MRRIVLPVAAAAFLGLACMIIPVLTYPQVLGSAENFSGESFGVEDYNQSWRSFDKLARNFGELDEESSLNIQTRILEVTFLIGGSAAASLIITQVSKNKVTITAIKKNKKDNM